MAGTFRGNPVESIHDYYCFHCQAGRFDLVDSTAFMGVGCALLYSKIPPSLVTSNLAICVNISDIAISVGSFLLFFQPRALSLCQHRRFAAIDISKFPDRDRSVSAGRC